MRGLVILIAILAVMASFSFVALSISGNSEKAEIIKESKPLEFSTYTAAVCEDKGEVVHCRDEFFVNCNGTVSKAIDVAECEGIKVEVPKALGFATFSSDWKDPRQ